jgi:hypothetical protein
MSEKVIIRTYSAGVHYGTLVSEENSSGGIHVTLENSRRIWKWGGANSLSELATIGTSSPDDCKFSLPVKKIKLLAIEIIYTTDEAMSSIENVPLWQSSKDVDKTNEVLEKYQLS